jgi:hypothetical protein
LTDNVADGGGLVAIELSVDKTVSLKTTFRVTMEVNRSKTLSKCTARTYKTLELRNSIKLVGPAARMEGMRNVFS